MRSFLYYSFKNIINKLYTVCESNKVFMIDERFLYIKKMIYGYIKRNIN